MSASDATLLAPSAATFAAAISAPVGASLVSPPVAARPARPPAIPLIAGRYEPRDRIGQGAMGQVVEAYDHRLGRLVALKLMPCTDDAEACRRFELEAQSVARLRHPGIVTVHDVGQGADFRWIAMELVIGETLKSVLDRGEPVPLSETVRVICALLDALGHAHGRGIVHRDVKPANILLAMGLEEGLGEVRLADFGIARASGGLGEETERTRVGEVLGTPSAMAPEQLLGEVADHRADLWAVGIILYQMLTGRRPFTAALPALYAEVLSREPAPPSALVPGLPPGFDAVIATALAKPREGRFANAAAMAAAIRPLADRRAAHRVALTAPPDAGGAASPAAPVAGWRWPWRRRAALKP